MSEQGSDRLCVSCGTVHSGHDICPARDGDDREVIAEIQAEMAAKRMNAKACVEKLVTKRHPSLECKKCDGTRMVAVMRVCQHGDTPEPYQDWEPCECAITIVQTAIDDGNKELQRRLDFYLNDNDDLSDGCEHAPRYWRDTQGADGDYYDECQICRAEKAEAEVETLAKNHVLNRAKAEREVKVWAAEVELARETFVDKDTMIYELQQEAKRLKQEATDMDEENERILQENIKLAEDTKRLRKELLTMKSDARGVLSSICSNDTAYCMRYTIARVDKILLHKRNSNRQGSRKEAPMATSKFKPCPFCGSNAIELYDGIVLEISCDKCGARLCSYSPSNTVQDIIKQWNTRQAEKPAENTLDAHGKEGKA